MSNKRLSTRDLVDSDEQDIRKPDVDSEREDDPKANGQARQEPRQGGQRAHADMPAAESASSHGDEGGGHEPLFPADQSERFTGRWQEIQTTFVDAPQQSVEDADALVADLMQRLAGSFANERERLEAQWDRGDDVSTEDLRVALTRYRSFFERLLSA